MVETDSQEIIVDDKLEAKEPIDEPTEKVEEPKKFGVLNDVIKKAVKDTKEVEEKVETEVVEKPKLKRLEEKSQSELIEDVKKWTSIANTRQVEIDKMSKDKPEPDKKYVDFIDKLKTDVYGTLRDYADEFGLPSVSYLQNQLTNGGDRETRIQQWQENELIPNIEKKFKIDSGTFVPDPSDFFTKGTASEYYRRMTADKEKQMDSEYAQEQSLKEKVIKEISEQRQKDLDYISSTFYGEDKEGFESKISEFDSIPEKVAKGELTQDMNPFSIRNIFRGVYFEELAEARIKKAISDVHKQYNTLGLYLPKNKSMPLDATLIKGSSSEIKNEPKTNNFSMIDRTFNKLKN